MAQQIEEKDCIISQLQENVHSLESRVSKLSQEVKKYQVHDDNLQLLGSEVNDLGAQVQADN